MLRRDSLGMPKYFKAKDVLYYENQMITDGIPLLAENGWNYFAHDFEGYMDSAGNPFTTIRDMLEASLNDAKASRANTFDLRVPEDAREWMNHEDLVDDFIVNGGYRFVPVSFKYRNVVLSNESMQITSTWKNTGLGRIPNDRPAWNYKYKVAYAFLNPEMQKPVLVHITEIDPSEWIKGKDFVYKTNINIPDVPNGNYVLSYAIVNTANGNIPEINLAVKDEISATGWYMAGEITVHNSDVDK